jgi:transcriptional regulator with XRE-family HTH domain
MFGPMARLLGENIRRLRKHRKLTLKELGDLVGYAESTLCEVESGRIAPSSRKLPKLAAALGVGVDDLYAGVM